eukprot:jgi/Mesen1/1350/ME000013S00843
MVLGSHQPARGGGAGEGAGEERVPLFSRDLEAADSPRESPKAISTKRDGPRSVRVLIVKHPSDCDLAEPESPREHAGDAEWTWRGSLRAALLQLLPCIQWISEYNVKEDLRADLVAGVTVGCMLVPQAMSYAKLAGMPPIYGLCSFSRSAVNNEAGARTGLAGAFVGLIMFVTLLFLTPLFVDIPQQCVLGAMIVSAVMGLVDFGEACFLWRVDKKDFLLWMAAFLGTLLAGIEVGVLIAVSMSLAFVIHESANPHMAVLGRLPGTTVYRNIRQYPEARTYRGIVAIRVDAPIYFANISFIKERLRKYELQTHGRPGRSQAGSPVRFVIIEMSPVTYIDSTAAHALKELHDEYRARGIQLALSNPNPKVMTRLAKAGIPDMIGREWYFVRVHDAVQVCISELEGRGEGTTYIKSFHNGVNGGTLGEDLHESGGGRPFKAEWRDPVRSGAAQDRSRAKEDDEQPGGSRGSGHVADLNAVSVNLL